MLLSPKFAAIHRLRLNAVFKKVRLAASLCWRSIRVVAQFFKSRYREKVRFKTQLTINEDQPTVAKKRLGRLICTLLSLLGQDSF